MSMGKRYNNFYIPRPPLAFGVQWDTSISDPNACLTRLGDAVGLEVNTTPTSSNYSLHVSDFDAYYPWAGIRRVILNHNGDYVAAHGETDALGNSTFAENTEKKVMVEVPKFWYMTLRNYPTPGVWQYWVSPFPLRGFRIYPAFQRGGNGQVSSILDAIYVGAYEAFADVTTRPAFPKLYSMANVSPTVGYSRAQFRSFATYMGTNCTLAGPTNLFDYGIMDWQTWNMFRLLYLVEYASLDSMTPSGSTAQGGLSAGITNATAVQNTGWTGSVDVNLNGLHSVDLGNGSGQVKCAPNVYASSYRGVENLFGNTFTLLDAINIATDRSLWINYTGANLADQVVTGTPYATSTLANNYSTSSISPISTGVSATIDPTYTQVQVAASVIIQNNTSYGYPAVTDGVTIAIYRTLAGGTAPVAGAAPGQNDSLVWVGTYSPPNINQNETVPLTFVDTGLVTNAGFTIAESSYTYYVCICAVNGSSTLSTAKAVAGSTMTLTNFTGVMGWPYVQATYLANATSGNPMYPAGWASYDDDAWMFEKFVMGGSTSTYMCAAYTVGTWSAERVPRVGGAYNGGRGSGIFCEDITLGYGGSDALTGARLQYIRPPISYYRY